MKVSSWFYAEKLKLLMWGFTFQAGSMHIYMNLLFFLQKWGHTINVVVPGLILWTTFHINIYKAIWGVLMAAICIILGYTTVGSIK